MLYLMWQLIEVNCTGPPAYLAMEVAFVMNLRAKRFCDMAINRHRVPAVRTSEETEDILSSKQV